MLFNTFQFALFLAAVLLVYRGVRPAARNGVLLGSSLLFYFLWIPPYLLLLLAEIAVNFALLRGMLASRRPRLYLVAAVVFTLGFLAYFKYAAFLVASLLPFSEGLFGRELPIPEIVLPLGISFFSFQILSLTIDSYRGRIEPVRSLAEYALFVSFFPQLIAGPILRGHQFLPQLRRGGEATPERSRRGLWLLASGLGKKVIIADFLLAPFANEVFAEPGAASAARHLMAIYSFAFQIYFDFSGYTDMARGIALLLGFEIPPNFLEPYLSRNPAEFWRRWHITLSQWLRDYLYIPLGGNRGGSTRLYRNLALTMLLGGLWHGAGWNFVIWGGLHGVLLAAHRRWGRQGAEEDRPLAWSDLPRILLLFHAVCLLWVFFRAQSFEQAMAFLGGLVPGSGPEPWPLTQTLIVVACALLHAAERAIRLRLPRIREALETPWGALSEGAAFGALVALAIAAGGIGGEFIYFQF